MKEELQRVWKRRPAAEKIAAVSIGTMWRWIKEGTVKTKKIGSITYVDVSPWQPSEREFRAVHNSDKILDEVKTRIARASAELWREGGGKRHKEVKVALSNALHGETKRAKEYGIACCQSQLEEWLREGDVDSIARFGRFAEEVAHKGAGRSYPEPSREEYLYMDIYRAIRMGYEMPTKAELMSEDYFYHSERTIQRCFTRIAELGGLRWCTKDGKEVWSLAPSS